EPQLLDSGVERAGVVAGRVAAGHRQVEGADVVGQAIVIDPLQGGDGIGLRALALLLIVADLDRDHAGVRRHADVAALGVAALDDAGDVRAVSGNVVAAIGHPLGAADADHTTAATGGIEVGATGVDAAVDHRHGHAPAGGRRR